MSESFDAAAHCDHMAAVMGLPVAPEWRAGVIANLEATSAMAAFVLSFPLDDHVEPAPVFEA
ncbi:DUF4089 domain-containing protein [Propylenella binzhouense]|uniref:DUF4089 domain-containing protein n=1 Tax=Propylenella binzhouense TaxID=2555902 RepID=A0A964T4D7_9HYPH|nr:DUF4089 domain-containing protein [Propylenella binzhouense]MYZ48263.1 DUF4089 domain-containing protein [Propylenella binzhouense]